MLCVVVFSINEEIKSIKMTIRGESRCLIMVPVNINTNDLKVRSSCGRLTSLVHSAVT